MELFYLAFAGFGVWGQRDGIGLAGTHRRDRQDCIFGVGILQVVMKHWFEGRFAPWVWSYFFPALLGMVEALWVFVLLFNFWEKSGFSSWTHKK